MNQQPIELSKEVKKRYIQRLEHSIYLERQKLIEYEEKLKSKRGLSISHIKILEDKISSLKKIIIPKETAMLIKLRNWENNFFDIKLITPIISYVDSKDESICAPIKAIASNSQDKSIQNTPSPWYSQPNDSESRVHQQVDLGCDPMANIQLDPEIILTSDEQTAQIMKMESSFKLSDFDDMALNPSAQSGPSSQKVHQQVDLGCDPMSNIQLDPEIILTSDEQTAQIMKMESSFKLSDFDDMALNPSAQSGPNSQKVHQQVDLGCDPMSNIQLDPEIILTSDEQTAQIMKMESSFKLSDFDDMALNPSAQSGPSSQKVHQQVDLGCDPMSNIQLDPEIILTSDEQTAQIMKMESSFKLSDFDDMALNPSAQSSPNSSELRLQNLTQKQSCEKATQSGANSQNLQQEAQQIQNLPKRILTNWVNKQKQQVLPSSQQNLFYASKTIKMDTAHSHDTQSAISTSDEYLKLQLQSTNETNSNQKKVPHPEPIPTRSTVIVEVPQQPISSELWPNSSTVQQRSDANKSTDNTTFLRNPLNQLGKRKADFEQTEQDQINAYNQFQELAEERYRNVEENKRGDKEVQEPQAPKLISPTIISLSNSQKMKIIELVESANAYNLERLYDMKDQVEKEKDIKIRTKLRKRAWEFGEQLNKRISLLNRFKSNDTNLAESDILVRRSLWEEKRLQNFANVQQPQPNQPGPSRSTSQPINEIEQLKVSIQQLNDDEEYLNSKWKKIQQERLNEELLREEEQSPEKQKRAQDKQRIIEEEHNEKLQELLQLENDKKEITKPSEAKTQSQLQDYSQPGPSRLDMSPISEEDYDKILSPLTEQKFDNWVETILNTPSELDNNETTLPKSQTNQLWSDLVQKFKDTFTAIPPDPILAAQVRRKIKQEAKSRQEEKTRLKKIAEAKSKLLKQKEEEVLNLKIEILKLWKEEWDNKWLCRDSSDKLKKLQILKEEAKKERDQLREEVRGLKYYLRKVVQGLLAIVDGFYWLVGGLSDPGFRYEVENSFENKRKKTLNELLPALIDEERGACTSNAKERVKNQFSKMTGIDLKDSKNLSEFNKAVEKIQNSRITSQGLQSFSKQVEHANETRAARQKQADSTPSGMAEKNARDEAISRAEIDYLAQTLPQRLAEVEVIRLQQAKKNTMLWMEQNPHKFSRVNDNYTKTGSQQQGQRSWLQSVNNSTASNSLAEALICSREVPKAQEEQMTLERAMKLWSHPNPKFKSYNEMLNSAYMINGTADNLFSNPERFKPTSSVAEQAISTINRNTAKILASKSATTNSSTHMARKPTSTSNVSGQKSNSQKTNKKVAVPE